jgi:hypothetical protein
MELNEAWADACLRLWKGGNGLEVNMDEVSVWDGLRYLYMKCSIPSGRGRNAGKLLDPDDIIGE